MDRKRLLQDVFLGCASQIWNMGRCEKQWFIWGVLFGVAAFAQSPPAWNPRGAFFALYAHDAHEIADWYVRNLGFRVTFSADLPKSPDITRAVMLEHNGSFIEILQPRQRIGDVNPDRPRYDDLRLGVAKLGFVVADLPALESDLARRGVIFNHHSVESGATKLRTFAIRDNEGNTIQFFGP